MTNHPLTDEKALSLFSFERLIETDQPMTVEDAMRKAADWQLDCDAEFWRIVLISNLGFTPEAANTTIESFKKAMRSTQEEDS